MFSWISGECFLLVYGFLCGSVHGVFSSFLFWIVCGILAGYILTILVCNILYGINVKNSYCKYMVFLVI